MDGVKSITDTIDPKDSKQAFCKRLIFCVSKKGSYRIENPSGSKNKIW